MTACLPCLKLVAPFLVLVAMSAGGRAGQQAAPAGGTWMTWQSRESGLKLSVRWISPPGDLTQTVISWSLDGKSASIKRDGMPHSASVLNLGTGGDVDVDQLVIVQMSGGTRDGPLFAFVFHKGKLLSRNEFYALYWVPPYYDPESRLFSYDRYEYETHRVYRLKYKVNPRSGTLRLVSRRPVSDAGS